ncbi:MAG: CheR family methyltransferase [Thermodesulfobacteriota bacterium]
MPRHATDSQLATVSRILASRLGLLFRPERWDELDRQLVQAADLLRQGDSDRLVHRLVSGLLTPEEAEALTGCLTVGETYFFREPKSFATLTDKILPERLAARAGSRRRLRLWSIACSTGEEAYSLAMVLDRYRAELGGWQVAVLGTDINAAALATASRGVYGPWSFRGLDEESRQTFFRPLANGRWEIVPRLRRLVTFRHCNLAKAPLPDEAAARQDQDVIFCRNLLMYWEPEMAAALVARLHANLAPEGWLVAGPTDAPFFLASGLFTLAGHGPMIFRPQGPASPVAGPPPERPVAAAEGLAEPPAADRAACLLLARCHAKKGQLAAAATWCQRALALERLDPEAHYLAAGIALELGQAHEGIKALERCLYLAPEHLLAHFTLGNLRCQQGNLRAGRRHLVAALTLARRYPPAAILPGETGLSAGRLVAIIATMLGGEGSAHG